MHKDYSQTPLPDKLGIKDGFRVALQRAPEGFAERLGVRPRSRGELDVVVHFATKRGALTRAFAPLARRLAPAGGLWVAWPKKSSDVQTDLSFEAVQEIGLAAGLVDNKSCSIDETWQALRFVYRLGTNEVATEVAARMCRDCGYVELRGREPDLIRRAEQASTQARPAQRWALRTRRSAGGHRPRHGQEQAE